MFFPVTMLSSPTEPPVTFSADLTSSALAIASGNGGGSYLPTTAFDNTTTNGWIPANDSNPGWIGQDFGSGNAKTIRKISLRHSGHGGFADGMYIAEWKLQRSSDGSSWTDVALYAGGTTLTMTNSTTAFAEFVMANVGAHRYWRVLAITQGSNAWYAGLAEIEMFEAA